MAETPEIVLYQFPGTDTLESISPFCIKAHRLLNRKRLSFTVKDLLLPGEIKKVNPMGKLPVISFDGRIVADSAHIARFLEAQLPDPPLFPKEEGLRARNVILEDWADESLYFMNIYFRWFNPENAGRTKDALVMKLKFPLSAIARIVAPPGIRQMGRAQGTGRKSYDMVKSEFTELADALNSLCTPGPFFLGSEPYLADIAVFGMLRGLTTGMTPDAGAILLGRPRLAEWFKRVDEATGPV